MSDHDDLTGRLVFRHWRSIVELVVMGALGLGLYFAVMGYFSVVEQESDFEATIRIHAHPRIERLDSVYYVGEDRAWVVRDKATGDRWLVVSSGRGAYSVPLRDVNAEGMGVE